MINLIGLFESYIVGNFSNIYQVRNELTQGQQQHPYAQHINRKINHLIKNRPQNETGFYLLEESIYQQDGITTLKPHIFYFDMNRHGKVVLNSFKHPKNFSIDELKNSNTSLWFDYNELELSSFKPLTYEFSEEVGFWGESISVLGEGKVFRLQEVISKDYLEVMEEMSINGNIVTAYKTPIMYEKEKNND
jgi:hypothetical protein